MASRAVVALRIRVRRFGRSEDGSLLVFSLMLFSIMVLVSGLAIDLMRVENRRVALSQTLDRCTLNAAALRQTLDPATVVRDCIGRAGMLAHVTGLAVSDANGTRSVEARGRMDVETLFMDASGIDSIAIGARSVAAQGASRIEIVLALDISASMNSNDRIGGLRTAARNFVRTVLANDPERVSIAVVPYNAQVNLGPTLAARYNITQKSGLGVTQNGDMRTANCVDMPTSAYAYTGIPPAMELPAAGWFDAFSGLTAAGVPVPANALCRPSTVNIVRPPNNDLAGLETYLTNLRAEGNTSINLGMKWAGALLDPQTRPIIADLAAAGIVRNAFRDRPFDYDGRDVLKIVVLMTDGENTYEARLNDGYRVGTSPIFRGTDGRLSIQHISGRPASAGRNEFWVPHLGRWQATSWGGSTGTRGTMVPWQEVWQIATPVWVAENLYGRALGTSTAGIAAIRAQWLQTFVTGRGSTLSGTPLQDAELQSICDATKRQGVLIYGIAFSAPQRGITTVRNCASSDAHFFQSTDNTALNAAFQAIASNITQLRLVF